MSTRWSESELQKYRMQGDPEVDQLVEAVLPKGGDASVGRLGYNYMLVLADQLLETPELAFVEQSRLFRQLHDLPDQLVNYFDPMPAPRWIDTEKLEFGARLWQQNTLLTLAVLYSASLPSCYLLKKGIPALYQSEKLRERRYIFQRIYETGLMLAATMDAGGITIINDIEFDDEKLLQKALHNLDPAGKWHFHGRSCTRDSDRGSVQLEAEAVRQEMERLRGTSTRYLWGAGYITAKKVRFLHASMRYLLMHADDVGPLSSDQTPETLSEALRQRKNPWDLDQYGCPINQEDLAYTLLTFGLVIPRGLARWGVPVSDEQKEAFLHLWRVIGHIMGLRSELMTDNWPEAEQLFALIQKRQAGYSKEGVILTEALMGFLDDYLPLVPGLGNRLSTALMISQIGAEHASYIITDEVIRDTNRFWRRVIYTCGGGLFRLFLSLRGRFYRDFTHLGGLTSNSTQLASRELIESWRGAFVRKPFFVPSDATTWVRKPGVDEAFVQRLKSWRRRVFKAIGIAMVLLVTAIFALATAVPAWLLFGPTALNASLIVAVVSWLSSLGIMYRWLPLIFTRRPIPDAN